jgi:hypothetical protein
LRHCQYEEENYDEMPWLIRKVANGIYERLEGVFGVASLDKMLHGILRITLSKRNEYTGASSPFPWASSQSYDNVHGNLNIPISVYV